MSVTVLLFACIAILVCAEERESNAATNHAAKAQAPAKPTPLVPINQPSTQPNQPQSAAETQKPEPLWPKFLERLIDPVTWFTFFLLVVSVFQWRAMLRQSKHMEEGLTETRASIAEAAKSAQAMQSISDSLASNVGQLESAMAINKRMADTQERVMVLQNRAYLQTEQWKVFRMVDEFPDQSFISPHEAMVRFFIRNKGHSPATLKSIRRFIHWSQQATVLELDLVLESGEWVEQRIPFRLEDGPNGEVPKILREPFTIEVAVDYFDGFSARRKSFTRRTWDHMSALTLSEKPEEQEWLVYGGSAKNSDIVIPSDPTSDPRQN